MKRDLDLIRGLLEKVEGATGNVRNPIRLEGYEPADVEYNAALLVEAGLLRGEETTMPGWNRRRASVRSLTWKGHEFLDAVRNDTVWRRTKEIAAKASVKTFDGVFDIAKSVTAEVLKGMLTKP
jgi:hypothetical protein